MLVLNVTAHDSGSLVEAVFTRLSTPGAMCASISPSIKIRASSTILGCIELCTESFAGIRLRRGSNTLLLGSVLQSDIGPREPDVP